MLDPRLSRNRAIPDIDLKSYIAGIPLLSPKAMFDIVAENGYVGQVRARKAVCLMAYRHINRIKKLHLDGVLRSDLPTKENCLLVGPTGCGKTFLIELLFQKILNIPTVMIDITSQKYENELRLDGIELVVEEAVYDLIVEECIKKETGARGLKSLITEYLEDACFDIYSSPNHKNIKLFVDDKQIRWEIY